MLSIETGNHSVKIMRKENSGEVARILCANTHPVIDQNLTLDEKLVFETLKGAADADPAYLSISGPGVIIRNVKLPKSTLEEAEKLIAADDKYLPLNIDKNIFTHKLVSNGSDARENEDYIFVGIKKEKLLKLTEISQRAGLLVRGMEVDSIALYNAFLWNYAGKDHCCALVNIGARHSTIVIVHEDLFMSCRELEVGGNDITHAISIEKKIGPLAAENEKINHAPYTEPYVKAFSEAVAEELKNTFSFYEDIYKHPIKTIYLSGGAVASLRFTDHLSKHMDMAIELFSPSASKTKDAPADYYKWAVPFGIGIGSIL